MRSFTLTLFSVLILGACMIAWGAAPPDLNGTWKANTAKSDFGPMPAPTSVVVKIEQKEPHIKSSTVISSDQGEFTVETELATDGTETTNQFGPTSMKTKARWEGNALMVESKGSGDSGDFTSKEKWTLSEDGKTLTVVRSWSGPMGEATQNMIYEKQ
jgi:hypothetical protein